MFGPSPRNRDFWEHIFLFLIMDPWDPRGTLGSHGTMKNKYFFFQKLRMVGAVKLVLNNTKLKCFVFVDLSVSILFSHTPLRELFAPISMFALHLTLKQSTSNQNQKFQ